MLTYSCRQSQDLMLLFVPAAVKHASIVTSVSMLRPLFTQLRRRFKLQALGW